ncbi:hypothetical protein CEP52_006920 [Fusarium oligoseptatum]|uniref:Enoyl reductase (ER) domain-containing protein n=2 Tax=Fusarium solani species complex TaxID=232080 RepID=A0A428TQT5_9HYPO|nr:hypothetical protein CEP51_015052 [Fusarium floridanum]RSM04279.1 hypothetical protein CEP52_006920 [Fusarium oligoseptatum]
MSGLPSTYKAWVIPSAGAPIELRDIELKQPGAGEILVKVRACGVCFTDVAVQQGGMGDVFPRIPGHEIVGDVVAIGEGVGGFSLGQRVGGAWLGGHDNVCRSCRRGLFQSCSNAVYNGASRDGGYAEYVLLRSEAAVSVPEDMDPAEAAPLLCAGLTVFNAIRKAHIEQGNLVAVQGIGGLGHMAIQYARKMGYKVAVVSSSASKKDLALQLGAHAYIDTSSEDAVKKLQELGGVALVVATSSNGKSVSALTGAMQAGGKMVLLAASGPVEFNTTDLVMGTSAVQGWLTGNAQDAEDTIDFAKHFDVKCMIERFPFEEAPRAMDRMTSGAVRFRGVLTFD